MDISAEIAAIQAASQGSELRQPLVGALNKLNSGSLPVVSSSDAGKILKVDSSGNWIAGEKSGYMPVPTASLNITENGTIDVLNYAQAVVAVSGGGGGVELMLESAWNALTTEQKKAKGLVAIQKYNSGYNRGILVNGADYSEIDIYLPYSDLDSVKCFARYENFDPNSLYWGYGEKPISFSALCSQYSSEDAVYFDALSSSKIISLPLLSSTSDFTIYIVAKGISYASGDVIIMGSVNSWSINNLTMLYHRAGSVWRTSIYGSDTDLINTNNNYVVVALRSNSMNASWFANGVTPRLSVPYNAHGASFTFGSRPGAYETDLAVKFVGFIESAESDSVITNNIANLASIFNMS